MAITVVTANEASNEGGVNGAALTLSGTLTLSAASGNDRLVLMMWGATQNSGNTDLIPFTTRPQFNSTAATNDADIAGNAIHDSSTSQRSNSYFAYWDDGDLPASTGSYAWTMTLTGEGGVRMSGGAYIVEMTGVDQTTPIADWGSSTNFGTNTQSSDTLLTSAGNVQWSFITGGMNAAANDTVTTSDSERVDSVIASGGNRTNYACGYATDGTITQAKSTDHIDDLCIMIGINEAGAAVNILNFERGVMGGVGRGIFRT
jgi:hypothetical protein